jgi:multidrug efflux pump subunit AcrB
MLGSHQRHPAGIDDLNRIPIRVVNGATVFVKDVGQVRDGSAVQQNIVREDSKRAVLLSVIKNGSSLLRATRMRAATRCGSAKRRYGVVLSSAT